MSHHQRTQYTKVVHNGLTREEHIFSQEQKKKDDTKSAIVNKMCIDAGIILTTNGWIKLRGDPSKVDGFLAGHCKCPLVYLTVEGTPTSGFKKSARMQNTLRQALIKAYGEDSIQKTEKKPVQTATFKMDVDEFLAVSRRINTSARQDKLMPHVPQTPVEEVQLFSTDTSADKTLTNEMKSDEKTLGISILEISLNESDFVKHHIVEKSVNKSGFFSFFGCFTF